MKNLNFFLIILIIFSSCLQPNRSVQSSIQPAGREKIKKEKIKVSSKAVRDLPEFYIPGKTILVKIMVFPAHEVSGVIVEEKIPSGWKIVNSEPFFLKKYGNTYKWLFWGKSLSKFEIKYKVEIPETSEGKKVFDGVIKTWKEKTIPIGGKKEIMCKILGK